MELWTYKLKKKLNFFWGGGLMIFFSFDATPSLVTNYIIGKEWWFLSKSRSQCVLWVWFACDSSLHQFELQLALPTLFLGLFQLISYWTLILWVHFIVKLPPSFFSWELRNMPWIYILLQIWKLTSFFFFNITWQT